MIKRFERWGRRSLIALVRWLCAVKARPVHLPDAPRIVLIRLDERLGNVLLTTPLLRSLQARFPGAQIDVLANVRAGAVLREQPAVRRFLPFRKRALLSADGPLRCIPRLRRGRYDLCIDAANPTDPSVTQTILSRFSGATHTIGSAHGPFADLYSAPVRIAQPCHEIDLRLQLLAPLAGSALTWLPHFTPPAPPAALQSWLQALDGPYGVINVGARLRTKQLTVEDYAALVRLMVRHGMQAVISYGAHELALAQAVHQRVNTIGVHVAPPTDIAQLAALMAQARRVISADTGPMHLAVSVGVPTCGIFVSTDPQRFGYAQRPHACIDARYSDLHNAHSMIAEWIATA